MLAETYTQLVTNLPHIGAEITWDLILDVVGAVLLYPVGRWLLRKHDQRKHSS